jgi:hypothetical protein
VRLLRRVLGARPNSIPAGFVWVRTVPELL